MALAEGKVIRKVRLSIRILIGEGETKRDERKSPKKL
jgi:hypothetical protein